MFSWVYEKPPCIFLLLASATVISARDEMLQIDTSDCISNPSLGYSISQLSCCVAVFADIPYCVSYILTSLNINLRYFWGSSHW